MSELVEKFHESVRLEQALYVERHERELDAAIAKRGGDEAEIARAQQVFKETSAAWFEQYNQAVVLLRAIHHEIGLDEKAVKYVASRL